VHKSALLLLFIIIIIKFFYTPGSKGSRGLKTKVKNKAGMAIGPVDRLLLLFKKTKLTFFSHFYQVPG